jgi:PhnB protein
MASKSYIAEGYPAVIPSLSFRGTEAAITWYKNIFNAKEKMRMENPDKTIGHAELNIGNSLIFLAEDNPQNKTKIPKETNGNSISLYAYLPDVDETIKKAVQNGASLVMPAQDMFYGDRVGCINDPFGYTWVLATHVKDVSEAEMKKGMIEMAQRMEEMAHN